MKMNCLLACVLAAAGLMTSCAAFSQGKCVNYGVKVVKTYPHDDSAYTQGLFFHDGQLFESTGQYGASSLRKVDLKSGKVLYKKDFNRKYFGEGSCVAGGKLYMLTWTNKVAFVYNPLTLEYEKTYAYPREGWGLTAIPGRGDAAKGVSAVALSESDAHAVAKLPKEAIMVASDGSGSLFYLDSQLNTVKTVNVTLNGKPVRLLNELEWIDGKIWANVYTTDLIFIINPVSGVVEGRLDCSQLYPHDSRSVNADVLNGIAVDASGHIFVTGKNWPKIYQIEKN